MPTPVTRIGINCVMSYSATPRAIAGLIAAPVVAGSVSNVTLNVTKETAEIIKRSNGGWKVVVGTLKDASVDFDLAYSPSDPAYIAFKAAFFNNRLIAVQLMDAPVSDTTAEGMVADWEVVGFNREEQSAGATSIKVTIKPGDGAVPPQWFPVPA